MPTVLSVDTFEHGDFTVPGGGSYSNIFGTPTKDTSIIVGNMPQAALFNGIEGLRKSIGTPRYGWHGFWFRREVTTDDALSGVLLDASSSGPQMRLSTSLGAQNAYSYIGGGSTSLGTIHIDAGVDYWIEMIGDFGATTWTLYWSINGVVQTPATLAGQSITTAGYAQLYNTAVVEHRNADWRTGSAVDGSDFLGVPTFAPPQRIRPDGDLATTGWSTAPLWSKIAEETADGTVISGLAS